MNEPEYSCAAHAPRRRLGSLLLALSLGTFASVAVGQQPAAKVAKLANRATGPAPLAVLFDATAADSGVPQPADHGAWHCEWDYGDATSGVWSTTGRRRNGGIGWLGAHVYEQPGDYTATLTTIDADGVVATFAQTITVTSAEVSTIYVSAAGSDANPGTRAEPLQSWNKGLSALFASTGPRRLLLRRGDTFQAPEHSLLSARIGPFWIGAYGEGDRPRVTATNDYGLCFAREVSGVCVTDVEFQLQAAKPVAWAEGWNCGPNTTFVRCRFAGFGNGLVVERSDVAVVDCEIANSAYGIVAFVDVDRVGQRLAVLGCRLDGATQHLLRYTMSRVLVGENVFGTVTGIGHAIKQQGRSAANPQVFSCVVGNRFDTACAWVHTIGPQDDNSAEHSLDTLVEGNLYRPTGGVGTVLCVFAERVTIRNNIIDVADGAECVSVRQRGKGPVPSRVTVENNTWLRRAGAPLQTMYRCQSADATRVRGNILWCAGGVVAPAGAVELAGNVMVDPRLGADYVPGAGSPAIDVGGTRVRTDATRMRRQGAVDAGAMEVR